MLWYHAVCSRLENNQRRDAIVECRMSAVGCEELGEVLEM